MTLSPFVSRRVKGLEGPEYPKLKVGPLCAAPGCSRIADHAHHLVRRSAIGGDFAWVEVEDEGTFFNLCALCHVHHLAITDNKAQIKWTGTNFVWNDGLMVGVLINPQPPAWGREGGGEAEERGADSSGVAAPVGPAAVEKCPECLRALPREKLPGEKREAKKNRKSWTVAVPVDAREDGAETLDVLLSACADLFGHSDSKKLRFYSLSQALALVVQHGHMLVGDGTENV
jgi:hypothetical protein